MEESFEFMEGEIILKDVLENTNEGFGIHIRKHQLSWLAKLGLI